MKRFAAWVCILALSCFALGAIAAEKEQKDPKATHGVEKKTTTFKPSKDTRMKADPGSGSSGKSGTRKTNKAK